MRAIKKITLLLAIASAGLLGFAIPTANAAEVGVTSDTSINVGDSLGVGVQESGELQITVDEEGTGWGFSQGTHAHFTAGLTN
ncbi:hypothetical protein [Nocardia brasiliensis]|uniref:hypothetical protein n=1 Tax=Nocardia brasiliensis TaxID=37326 RepID=UPI0011DD2B63|nr:hypothetical protein [Nocardia brasiliensis]